MKRLEGLDEEGAGPEEHSSGGACGVLDGVADEEGAVTRAVAVFCTIVGLLSFSSVQ